MVNINNIVISTFDRISATKFPINRLLIDVLNDIKEPGNEVKSVVHKIRTTKNPDEQRELKTFGLPVMCPAGVFSERNDSSLVHGSGVICLDLDHVQDIKLVKSKLKDFRSVLSVFRSPSDGLKVLICHDLTNHSRHNDLYEYLGAELKLKGRTDLSWDSRCGNISRACFLSYDRDIYINNNPEVLHVDISKLPFHLPTPKTTTRAKGAKVVNDVEYPPELTDTKQIIDTIAKTHSEFENHYNMFPGTRNKNLFILASFLRLKGVPEEVATEYLIAYYADAANGFGEDEIKRTIKSAYN